jgi:NAD(P)-dependent dehydrogenase (short-subunit alcohol dehydrogenase family)
VEGLAGKVALVTGAASGLGAASARRLAREGAHVVAVDIDGDAADALAEEIGNACGVRADVSQEADVVRSMQEAVARFGRIDLYHLNAGIAGATVELPDVAVDDFDRVMAVNVRGVFLGLREAFRRFAVQDSTGAVVATASICSFGGGADLVPYHTSKHAILGLVRSAAVYGGPRGIRVNAVAPGIVPTNLLGPPVSSSTGSGGTSSRALLAPLRRPGTPDEIASVVAFVASDDASAMTGASVAVDCGLGVRFAS